MDHSDNPIQNTNSYTVSKPWGYEYVFIKTDNYVGKVLHIEEGHRISLQYHEIKSETLYIIKGRCEIILGTELNIVEKGATIHIKAGEIHRIRALSECEIIEISTPEIDDIVRLEDDYNRC